MLLLLLAVGLVNAPNSMAVIKVLIIDGIVIDGRPAA
jgi:hypothetical protein